MKTIRLLLIGVILFAGCALKIPNVEICADEGKFGAFCQYTTSPNMKRTLTQAQWFSVRSQDPEFCMQPAGLGTYNSFVSDQCAITAYNKNWLIWCEQQKPAKQIQPKFRRAKPQGLTDVTIPNIQICADELDKGAYCQYTVSGPAVQLTPAQWDQARFGMFCMNTEALAEYQLFIESSCNYNKDCINQAGILVRKLRHMRFHQQKNRTAPRFRNYPRGR